jgi:hypothetical protein
VGLLDAPAAVIPERQEKGNVSRTLAGRRERAVELSKKNGCSGTQIVPNFLLDPVSNLQEAPARMADRIPMDNSRPNAATR